ncbi:uncharacterized protein DNG_04131 [Cephalotrichum gorgonifer]|uniref:Uncharacterized protein n=1 Tax=Cephalotrichum gorgonifer TaxID=2041049 RepID=A0AAE8MXD8_9PEZI|nr:uncharacterized protein DNG_04131 [Cephalotrichum gorgonifer]
MKLTAPLFLAALASAAHNWDVYRIGTVDNFAWKNTMPADGGSLGGYNSCETAANFTATQYKVTDIYKPRPEGLAPWATVVNGILMSRFYPGAWQGVNYKGGERDVVMMEYKDVPQAVRVWVEEQLKDEAQRKKRWLTVLRKSKAVDDMVTGDENLEVLPAEEKVMIFAPGEIYDSLPLWVAQGSKCEAELKNLSKYVPYHQDDAVIAWAQPITLPDRENGGRDLSFSVEAKYIRETEEGRTARLFWERAHAAAERHNRKQVREERMGKRALTQAQRRDKDEL